MNSQKSLERAQGESGQVTIDFLFASVLILGVSTLIMALTIALSLTEVMQYISFSAARCYFAADENKQEQVAAAVRKANYLLSDSGLPFLKGALANGWITITGGRKDDGSRASNYTNYAENLGVDSQDTRSQFIGYQIKFEVPILGLKLPLLGPAIEPPQGKKGFEATVSSFLMREPTRSECNSYTQKVFNTLLQKNPDFQKATRTGGAASAKAFVAINDNGC